MMNRRHREEMARRMAEERVKREEEAQRLAEEKKRKEEEERRLEEERLQREQEEEAERLQRQVTHVHVYNNKGHPGECVMHAYCTHTTLTQGCVYRKRKRRFVSVKRQSVCVRRERNTSRKRRLRDLRGKRYLFLFLFGGGESVNVVISD